MVALPVHRDLLDAVALPDGVDDILPVGHFAKDGMLAIKVGLR